MKRGSLRFGKEGAGRQRTPKLVHMSPVSLDGIYYMNLSCVDVAKYKTNKLLVTSFTQLWRVICHASIAEHWDWDALFETFYWMPTFLSEHLGRIMWYFVEHSGPHINNITCALKARERMESHNETERTPPGPRPVRQRNISPGSVYEAMYHLSTPTLLPSQYSCRGTL